MTDIQPIFAKNRSTLLSRLRLTGAKSQDAISAIDGSLSTVAIGLFDRLGSTLVATIQGYTYTDDATSSADGRTRMKASLAEEKWLRYELLRKMPTLFMDSSASAGRQWNDEELSRQTSSEDELSRLWAEVVDLLDDLEGNTDTAAVTARVFSPDSTPVFVPGGSVHTPTVRSASE